MRAFSPSPFRLPPIGPMLLAGLLAVSAAVAGEEPRPYREGRFEKAELRYIDGLPVLVVQGTPAEMGRQKAALTGDVARKLADYPRKLIEQSGRQAQLPKVVELGNKLLPQFPAHHREELRAFADKTGLERERGILANTLIDTYREAFACSSLLVSAEQSATGGPLFGRNLDFYTLGMLDKYSARDRPSPARQARLRHDRFSGALRLPLGHERRGPGRGRPRGLPVARRRADVQSQRHALRASASAASSKSAPPWRKPRSCSAVPSGPRS